MVNFLEYREEQMMVEEEKVKMEVKTSFYIMDRGVVDFLGELVVQLYEGKNGDPPIDEIECALALMFADKGEDDPEQ